VKSSGFHSSTPLRDRARLFGRTTKLLVISIGLSSSGPVTNDKRPRFALNRKFPGVRSQHFVQRQRWVLVFHSLLICDAKRAIAAPAARLRPLSCVVRFIGQAVLSSSPLGA
jgi:hypothetical protein